MVLQHASGLLRRLPAVVSSRRLMLLCPRGFTSLTSRQALGPGVTNKGSHGRSLVTAASGNAIDADVIITNGHVIDPANDVDAKCDVAIKGDVIVAVGNDLQPTSGRRDVFYDAGGCLVTPGLIDVQVHAYQYATPYGIDIDRHCLGRGVTTAVDGGASGATTFMGLKKFIGETKHTRLFAFLNIAIHGMSAGDKVGGEATRLKDSRYSPSRNTIGRTSIMKDRDVGGEYDSLKLVDPAMCIKCIDANTDMIVGVKVRLRADACARGKNEDDAFRIALNTCQKTSLPLLTHHAESTIPSDAMIGTMSCPGSLRKGDIYSQVFQGHASGILNPQTLTLYESVLNAKQRGVFFDVGHGQHAFTWTVAERCANQGFYPDLISTNIHIDNTMGPVYDLPTVMSKMLHVGMPLNDVIKAVTANAANAIRRSDMIGSLGVGRCADITVLKKSDCDLVLEDSHGQMRKINEKLTPMAVWRAGARHDIIELEKFPNPEILNELRETLKRAIIRDDPAESGQQEVKN